jgi:hypothetical protein
MTMSAVEQAFGGMEEPHKRVPDASPRHRARLGSPARN